MKLQGIAVVIGSLALGACATPQLQSALNTEEEAASAIQQEASEAEAAAEGAQGEGEVTKAQAEVGDDRIICKRVIPTGTRFGRKECRSWREWREMREATQDILNEGQRRNLQVDTPRGG